MAKRFELYYGPSGEGKSSAVLAVAKQMWKERSLRTRVYIGDGSAATYEDSGLVDAGIIELFDYSARPNPFDTCSKICQCYWPDATGKLVKPKSEDLASLGLVVYEGLSVMGAYLMGSTEGGLAYRSGRGEKIGQDSPISIKDGDMTVGGNPMSHYNVAQRELDSDLEKSKAFPGWVIWTAHERSAEDKLSGEKIIGPEVVGSARTAVISRVFNNTLHFSTVAKKKKVKDPHNEKMIDVITTEYRVYTRDHYDADGGTFVKFKAVTRCPKPDLIPDYFTSEEPGDNVMQFYAKLAEAQAKVREEMGLAPKAA